MNLAKWLRINLSSKGVGASVRTLPGIRVGRTANGRLYVSMNVGVFHGRWFLPGALVPQIRPEPDAPVKGTKPDPKDPVFQALRALGFSVAEVNDVWEGIPREGPTEDRLTVALRHMRAARTVRDAGTARP